MPIRQAETTPNAAGWGIGRLLAAIKNRAPAPEPHQMTDIAHARGQKLFLVTNEQSMSRIDLLRCQTEILVFP